MKKNVEGKTFYIPSNVHYALPATEKQFIGNLPSNSYVSVPDDLIVGVHWMNTHRSIDLDFSLADITGKYGWNRYYRSSERDILFSGDITDAPEPRGASELFYMKKAQENPKIMFLNFYNQGMSTEEVPFKLFVAHDTPEVLDKNYVIDPNKMIMSTSLNIGQKQMMLGLVMSVNNENRVCLSNTSLGNTNVSGDGFVATKAREYMISCASNPISLDTLLNDAGAIITNEKPEGEGFIDLSPSALDKTTILGLLRV